MKKMNAEYDYFLIYGVLDFLISNTEYIMLVKIYDYFINVSTLIHDYLASDFVSNICLRTFPSSETTIHVSKD